MRLEREKAPAKPGECACRQGIRPPAETLGKKRPRQFLLPRKASCCFDNSNVPLVQSYQLSKQVAVHSRLTPFHYGEADHRVTESK